MTEFVQTNHLGSTSIVTDHTGAAARDMLFYPFGQVWQEWGSNYDTHFASLWQREFNSGLDPTPNRMFHSRLFRWMSPDPVGGDISNPQSLNRYAYVFNDPTSFTDPLGLQQGSYPGYGWLPSRFGGCKLDDVDTPCEMVWRAASSGAAVACPNNDCTGIRAEQGPGGSTVIKQWVMETASSTIGGTVFPGEITGGHWQSVASVNTDWAVVGVVGLAGAELGPADLALMTGTAAAIFLYKNKDAIKNIVSLMNNAAAHINSLKTDPNPDPRRGWRREIRAWIDKARLLQRRRSRGMWKDAMGALIDQVEWAVPAQ